MAFNPNCMSCSNFIGLCSQVAQGTDRVEDLTERTAELETRIGVLTDQVIEADLRVRFQILAYLERLGIVPNEAIVAAEYLDYQEVNRVALSKEAQEIGTLSDYSMLGQMELDTIDRETGELAMRLALCPGTTPPTSRFRSVVRTVMGTPCALPEL